MDDPRVAIVMDWMMEGSELAPEPDAKHLLARLDAAASTTARSPDEELLAECRKMLPLPGYGRIGAIRHIRAIRLLPLKEAKDWLDLRIPPASAPPPANTVRVRAAVAFDTKGVWCCYGGSEMEDDEMATTAADGVGDGFRHCVFIEADVPLPATPTISARVVEEGR